MSASLLSHRYCRSPPAGVYSIQSSRTVLQARAALIALHEIEFRTAIRRITHSIGLSYWHPVRFPSVRRLEEVPKLSPHDQPKRPPSVLEHDWRA